MIKAPPRIELARLPTPIDHLQDLSAELGMELFVKRDDLTGCALSGNKVRKLEYSLAGALGADADVVVTCGGAQSNHCRATAIAARRIGMNVELFLRDGHSAKVDGNLFLDLIMGATVHSLTPEEYGDRERIMKQRAEELEARGRNTWVIPEGASDSLGSFGYVRAMEEIVHQQSDGDLKFDVIICPVGSGGTLAGLLAGAELHGFDGRIIGVPVCDSGEHFEGVVNRILDGFGEQGLPPVTTRANQDHFLDGFVGDGYAKASFEDLQRIRDVAILTGLILDPVYTNKAFGGLLSLIRSGSFPEGTRILFLHTGGLFGLFPFADAMPHLMVP